MEMHLVKGKESNFILKRGWEREDSGTKFWM